MDVACQPFVLHFPPKRTSKFARPKGKNYECLRYLIFSTLVLLLVPRSKYSGTSTFFLLGEEFHTRTKQIKLNCLIFTNLTSLVAWWSELLTTNHEVPGSIPGSTMCVFP